MHTSRYLELSQELLPGLLHSLNTDYKASNNRECGAQASECCHGVINRLPLSEVLHHFVQDLLKLSMHVLACDNVENGLICSRIIFDLDKNFWPTLEPDLQQFLDFVHKIYQNFRATVRYVFDESSTEDVPAPHHNHGYMGQMRSPAGCLGS